MPPVSPVSQYQSLQTGTSQASRTTGNSAKPTLQAGQQVTAVVKQQVESGVYKLQIGQQTLSARVTSDLSTGSTVRLLITSTQPLVMTPPGAERALSTTENLGSLARLLSSLSQQTADKNNLQQLLQQTAVTGSRQLSNTSDTASALRHAIIHSGLFYESHQAQWLRGERPISQLLLEPQNRLNKRNPPPAASKEAGHVIQKELQPLVQQQLQTLEQQQLNWQGMIWPDQLMKWMIKKNPQEQRPDHSSQQHPWETEVELNLSSLGQVNAQLKLNNKGLYLKINTDSDISQQTLQQHLPELQQKLEDNGLTLLSSQISRDEKK